MFTRRKIIVGVCAVALCSPAIRRARAGDIWAINPANENRAFNTHLLKTPKRRATPTNEQELIEAFLQVRRENLPMRVQSSGHCFAGLSQSDDTLLDVRHLNQVQLNIAAKTMTTGAGANIAKINRATAPHNLVLPAGYCQTVALGGHVSGGGVGVLSRQFGLACDSLLSARIMTASGTVLDVDQENHSDLFWALRGGGAASFGIVTQYQFKLHQPKPVFLATVRLRPNREDAARWLMQLQELIETAAPTFSFNVYVTNIDGVRMDISLRLVSSTPQWETAILFNEILTLGHITDAPKINSGTFHEMADIMWPLDHYGERAAKIGSDFLAGPIGEEDWLKLISYTADNRRNALYFSIEALGGAIDDLSNSQTPYAHRGKAKYLIQYETRFVEGQPTEPRIAAFYGMKAALNAVTTGGAYFNYPEPDLPNWGEAYFGGNFQRLKAVKRRYDPDDVFNHPLSIPIV